ncbi:MAG: hypothetical protein K0Q73_7532 [Paenibacillus sp.]|nr:hypothetical protein [Paenibacillus sp.]
MVTDFQMVAVGAMLSYTSGPRVSAIEPHAPLLRIHVSHERLHHRRVRQGTRR